MDMEEHRPIVNSVVLKSDSTFDDAAAADTAEQQQQQQPCQQQHPEDAAASDAVVATSDSRAPASRDNCDVCLPGGMAHRTRPVRPPEILRCVC